MYVKVYIASLVTLAM